MKAQSLREALVVLADTGEAPPAVRAEIAESWSRSLRHGLDPEKFEVPFVQETNAESSSMQTAVSVLKGLSEDLSGEAVGVLLTDSYGRVVGRWADGRRVANDLDRISLAPGFDYGESHVGTNAIGSALERRSATFVSGQEHFADVLTQMACGAAPFFDPSTGRLLGVVDLTCRVQDANSLLLALARRAARDVSGQLARALEGGDRLLWERFLDLRRGAKGPLAVVSQTRVLCNAAAERLVHAADQPSLWEHAVRAAARNDSGSSVVKLASGVEVEATCEPFWAGGDLVGAAWRLRPAQEDLVTSALSATELSVTSLAVEGLTNRQVAERLFMSRFTVDSHLRSIYRKLGVASRLELARKVSALDPFRS